MSALTFDPAGHVYTLDGARVRSVTGLLRKVGLVNFDRIPPTILAAAQHRGTTVHQAIHFYNENDLDVFEFGKTFPGYLGYLESWMRLMATGRLQPVLCEHRVASRYPRYAGTLDFLGLFDGQAAILDFATGRPEDAAKHLQTAAYVMAAKAWANQPDQQALKAFVDAHPFIARYGVRLNKTGSLPTPTPYRDAKDYTKFRLIAETVQTVDEERPKSHPWEWEQEAA